MLAVGRAVKKMLRDPLAHFLVIGAALFAVYSTFYGDGQDRIAVSRENLLTFIQYRSKAFDPHVAQAKLAAMSPAELKQVIDDYITEEALYREAEALGLDKQDYIIKRRMVQKVEFIASGIEGDEEDAADEKDLRTYFQENLQRFSASPSYTFTQVFVASDSRSPAAAENAAKAMKASLTAQHAAFDDATRFGDRFPYGVNFVEASPEQIEGQFGADFLRGLASLKPDKDAWQGPIESAFGSHVVMLVAKANPKPARFEDVRNEVSAEYARVRQEEKNRQAVAKIVARYPVDMAFDDPRLKKQ